ARCRAQRRATGAPRCGKQARADLSCRIHGPPHGPGSHLRWRERHAPGVTANQQSGGQTMVPTRKLGQGLEAYYSSAGRYLERELGPLLNAEKMGLLVWSPLAGGLLSGKFSRDNQSSK